MHIISFTYGFIDMSVNLNIFLLYFVCTFSLHIAPPPQPKKEYKKISTRHVFVSYFRNKTDYFKLT